MQLFLLISPWPVHTQGLSGVGGGSPHGADRAPALQKVARPPRSSHRLQTLRLIVVFGLQASSFWLQQKRGHSVAERSVPLQTFLTFKVKKTKKTKKKQSKKQGRKQSDAQRQKLVPGLLESSPCAALMVCQQHVPRQDLALKLF